MKKVIIIILLIFILSILLIYFYSIKISPVIMKYAKIESKKIAINIISDGVSSDVIKLLDKKELFVIEKDNFGNVETIDYDSKLVNEVLLKTSKRVTKNFKNMEQKNKGIITKIPIGVITDNVFFENLGPKIPVKLYLDGNVLTSIKTNVKEYGLNSALIEVFIKIEANVQIVVPLYTKEMKVVNEVPISIKITKGNVSSIINNE